jgi:hypothetical protein
MKKCDANKGPNNLAATRCRGTEPDVPQPLCDRYEVIFALQACPEGDRDQLLRLTPNEPGFSVSSGRQLGCGGPIGPSSRPDASDEFWRAEGWPGAVRGVLESIREFVIVEGKRPDLPYASSSRGVPSCPQVGANPKSTVNNRTERSRYRRGHRWTGMPAVKLIFAQSKDVEQRT